jgi:hypothetical protein
MKSKVLAIAGFSVALTSILAPAHAAHAGRPTTPPPAQCPAGQAYTGSSNANPGICATAPATLCPPCSHAAQMANTKGIRFWNCAPGA